MSLDEKFKKLNEEYSREISIANENLEQANKIKNKYFKRFKEYEEKIEELSLPNRLNYYFFFALFYRSQKETLNMAENYFEQAVAAADRYNPKTEPEITDDNGAQFQIQYKFLRKKDCLNMLHRIYHEWGFTLAKNNKENTAVETFKKSIAYIFYKEPSIFEDKNYSLYSYRPVSKYFLHDLINKEITVTSPEEFNDPVDCPFLSILKRKREEYSREEKRFPLIEAYKFLKIRCFVRNPDVNHDAKEKEGGKKLVAEHKNFLMWSHYADSHKGICIKYCINNKFLINNEDQGIASRWINVDYNHTEFIYNRIKESVTIEQGFGTKAEHWSYENEFRLLHYDPNCNSSFKALPLGDKGNIEAIYFGIQCPEKDIDTIKAILGDHVAYFKMKEDDEDIFKLVEVPLNDKAKAMLEAASEVVAEIVE